ncbi:hypothetical protein QUF81_16435 [Peribacillus simplex]|uniref:hypothetical protein n=1 Tax=Peribacillus simplex TaxID=1478 RepID=UPI0025A25900|nr:hypothetical protein [Peribacillus simplex]MDM5294742.1 hypothetical protein [Peribacillus simplex]
MKEKIGWTLAIAALLIGGGIIYYFINLSLYETTEGLYKFPVLENDTGKIYEWSRSSEENGIPYGYE